MFKKVMTYILLGLFLCSCLQMGNDRRAGSRKSFNSEAPTTDSGGGDSGSGSGEDEVNTDPIVLFDGAQCACISGKPAIFSNCYSFCSNKNVTEPTLYGTVQIGSELEAVKGSLNSFCTSGFGTDQTQTTDQSGEQAGSNFACELRAKSDTGTTNLVMSFVGDNTFTANINTLEKGVTYVMQIVELSTGRTSDTFQIILEDQDTTEEVSGPLKLIPVARYLCMTRGGTVSQDTGNNIFDTAIGRHFFYPVGRTPPPLTGDNTFLFCHDIQRYGKQDSALYERIYLDESAFYLWNINDPRMYDQNNNGSVDINDLIKKKLLEVYNVNDQDVNLFSPLNWPNAPTSGTTESTSSSSSNPILGFAMAPFINQKTGRGYCPGRDEYSSNNPLFKILEEYIGVPTEALYIGVREPRTITDSDGNTISAPDDIILVRESVLKKIWFYYQNGKHYVPSESDKNTKQLMFYWPPDFSTPLQQKSAYQSIYFVRAPSELGGDLPTEVKTTVPPSDKRYACIPALE